MNVSRRYIGGSRICHTCELSPSCNECLWGSSWLWCFSTKSYVRPIFDDMWTGTTDRLTFVSSFVIQSIVIGENQTNQFLSPNSRRTISLPRIIPFDHSATHNPPSLGFLIWIIGSDFQRNAFRSSISHQHGRKNSARKYILFANWTVIAQTSTAANWEDDLLSHLCRIFICHVPDQEIWVHPYEIWYTVNASCNF